MFRGRTLVTLHHGKLYLKQMKRAEDSSLTFHHHWLEKSQAVWSLVGSDTDKLLCLVGSREKSSYFHLTSSWLKNNKTKQIQASHHAICFLAPSKPHLVKCSRTALTFPRLAHPHTSNCHCSGSHKQPLQLYLAGEERTFFLRKHPLKETCIW